MSMRGWVEADWLVTTTWKVLHHADLTEDQAVELDRETLIEGPVTLSCGRVVSRVCIPGVFSRMGKPRCQRCCDRLGYPRGNGAPKNDPACRRLFEQRLDAVTP